MLATRLLERFLEDAAGSLTLRRVEYPPLAEPERDVMRPFGRPEADEVASPEVALVDRLCGSLLLVRVPRYEAAEPAVGHVHEPGAVDPALGHSAPLVRRAYVCVRLGNEIAVRTRLGQPGPRDCPWDMSQVDGADPAGIVVRRSDPRPVAVRLLDRHRLAGEELRDLLGLVVPRRPDGRRVFTAEGYLTRILGSSHA